MKTLLTTLNSKYIHSNLALQYLYAVCANEGERTELREFTVNNPDDYIYGELLRGEYDLICFSCYIWNIERTLYLAETLKKARPGVFILLGGPEVTWRAAEIMKKNKSIDFVLTGEGEERFPKLLKELTKPVPSQGFDMIGGLLYRKEGRIYVNPASDPVDFTKVPFPFHSLVGEADKIMYYESSRGCPFSCSYCISAIEKGVRALPLERIKEDLSYFVYKNVKQVKFVDRTFNYNNARSMEILRYLMETDNGVTNFHFELCGDIISEELLNLIESARSGLFQFEIGVQSTNEGTLKAIARHCDFSKLSKNVKRIMAMGNIHMHLDLIAGLPYEDYESFANSFNEVYDLRPHMLQLGFLKLLPGTPIRENAEEYGYIFRSKAPYEVISNNSISAKELAKLKMVELLLDMYYNRGGFERALDYLAFERHPHPFSFYEEFSSFYYLKGFQHKSHNKEDLFRILNLYGRWKDKKEPGTGDRLELLLTEDMKEGLNPEAVKKFMKTGWDI
ncbi:MAG TPA: DUF4080 domain-containing protein [Bacillota bacterium]|mgnify:CR=1 FL=1|nr:DUF4080 domain-containing protein [Bacillota bacterium]